MTAKRKIQRNPLDGVKAPRVPRPVPDTLDPEQVAALLDAAPDTRARAIVWLEVGGALRSVECSRLNVEHWSRGSGLLLVHGKAGHQRHVPVTDEMRWALDAYLADWPAFRGPMFRSFRTGDRLSTQGLGQLVRDLMWVAGVKVAPWDGRGGHSLRRTAASDVLEASSDVIATQDLLGHATLASMQPYLRRANLSRVRTAMDLRSYGANAVRARFAPPPLGEDEHLPALAAVSPLR